MTAITTFTVCEEEAGWYVDGPSRIGPFASRAGAIQLAEELASFIRNDGEDAEVVYAPRPH
jgi:exo-beta-1,3-glucanase (GH17 family)